MPTRRFEYWDDAFPSFQHRLRDLAREDAVASVCDIGGGANPGLLPQEIDEFGLDYLLTDVSESELTKSDAAYATQVLDACTGAEAALHNRFDLVFSHLVAEHVPDPKRFHATLFDMLKPGGRSLHFFPTLFTFPFAVNRLLPEGALLRLLDRVQPGRLEGGMHDKFPASYHWCRGPSERQAERFGSVGFEVVEYVGFFGHGYYRPVPVLDRVEQAKSRWLAQHPNSRLTAFALLELRKPAGHA